jgi:hypothetical protein
VESEGSPVPGQGGWVLLQIPGLVVDITNADLLLGRFVQERIDHPGKMVKEDAWMLPGSDPG